jgi:choice-of-anchor C domain-containing protein
MVATNTLQNVTMGQSIGPWRVTSGNVDLIGAGFWQAADGDQSVDLNDTNAGAVSQTFRTTPGTKYTVTYSLAGNPDEPTKLKTGKVLIDGQNIQDFSFDTTGKTTTNMGYVRRQVTFVATSRSTTLTFASSTPNSAWGPVIDDVTVTFCLPVLCCGVIRTG